MGTEIVLVVGGKKLTREERARNIKNLNFLDSKIVRKLGKSHFATEGRRGRLTVWFDLVEASDVLGWTWRQLQYACEQMKVVPATQGKRGDLYLSSDQILWLLLFQDIFARNPVGGKGVQLRGKYNWSRMSYAWRKVRFRQFHVGMFERNKDRIISKLSNMNTLRLLLSEGTSASKPLDLLNADLSFETLLEITSTGNFAKAS